MGHCWPSKVKPQRALSALLIVGDRDPLNPLDGGLGTNPWGGEQKFRPPMQESVDAWLSLIGASHQPSLAKKTGSTLIQKFGPGTTGKNFTYINVEGQGHEWPGHPRLLDAAISGPQAPYLFDATELIWNFFHSAHAVNQVGGDAHEIS
jgi:polyhydroxybutyrate depolymerase